MSHEAGHAKLNHYENTVKRGVGLSVAATLLGKLFGGGIAETAAGVGANLAYAGWSREQEVEADDYSVHLAHKMGEDPVGLYSALLKLSKMEKGGEPSGFNSHPPDERRLLHLRNEILSLNPKAKFPDGSEKGAVQQPQSQSAGEPENTVAKKGGYDIDAAIERMKRKKRQRLKPLSKTADVWRTGPGPHIHRKRQRKDYRISGSCCEGTWTWGTRYYDTVHERLEGIR